MSVENNKPDVNMYFPEDMIFLEKWIPEKPPVIYYNGQKIDTYKDFVFQNTEQKFILRNLR